MNCSKFIYQCNLLYKLNYISAIAEQRRACFCCESGSRILLVVLYERGLKKYAVIIRVLLIMFKFFIMLNNNAPCSKNLTIILERNHSYVPLCSQENMIFTLQVKH